jgi:predicted nucleic acid-binding protein
MKVVIADTGALISLIHIGKIDLIEKILGDFFIAEAVWNELKNYDNPDFDRSILTELESKVVQIKSNNHLAMVMDYGESESVILYEELSADYLLIDDNKARQIAESLNVTCIGSIGLIVKARQNGLVKELRPIFEKWISTGRYFSRKLLNGVLVKFGEIGLEENNNR